MTIRDSNKINSTGMASGSCQIYNCNDQPCVNVLMQLKVVLKYSIPEVLQNNQHLIDKTK